VSSGKHDNLKLRTKAFALRVLKLTAALPRAAEAQVIRWQLAKAGTSVAANYRSACRARSKAEFASKIGVAEEEADESVFWLEVIIEGQYQPAAKVQPLLQEANELTAILVSSRRSARSA